MIASKLLASSALALVCWSWSTTAAADETAKPAAPAAKGNVVTVDGIRIQGRRQCPGVSVDVARLVPRAPLPELRQPLVDRIGKAIDKDPF